MLPLRAIAVFHAAARAGGADRRPVTRGAGTPCRGQGRTKGFVVPAELRVRRGCLESLLTMVRKDAPGSMQTGSGCVRSDGTAIEGGDSRVLFHAICDDRPALEEHPRTPHLARFREGLPALAHEPPVRFASLQRR